MQWVGDATSSVCVSACVCLEQETVKLMRRGSLSAWSIWL